MPDCSPEWFYQAKPKVYEGYYYYHHHHQYYVLKIITISKFLATKYTGIKG